MNKYLKYILSKNFPFGEVWRGLRLVGLLLPCLVLAQQPPLLIANFENVNEREKLIITDTVLVFQSGFEGTTRIVPYGSSTDDTITGADPDLSLSDWDTLRAKDIGIVHFNYTGGDASKRYAKIIDDPTRPDNKVLHFWLNDYWLASENEKKHVYN